MGICIHPSRSCLPPFYTIPIFPLSNRRILHLLVSFPSFLDAYCIFYLYSENALPEAICCCLHTCCVYVVLLELCYVCMSTCIAMGQLKAFLKVDCLRLFVVYKLANVVLLVIYCMCIPTIIVTVLI